MAQHPRCSAGLRRKSPLLSLPIPNLDHHPSSLQTGWCYRRKENFTFRYAALWQTVRLAYLDGANPAVQPERPAAVMKVLRPCHAAINHTASTAHRHPRYDALEDELAVGAG
jgi:hypothetical protein